jgi:hypothetical protein
VATEQLNVTFQNAERAYDLGAEVEARKSLRDLTENVFSAAHLGCGQRLAYLQYCAPG